MRCKEFHVGDLVMVHLHENHFHVGTHHKLHDKKIDPFHILQKIGENAYKIELPSNMSISPTFNVANIFEYFPPDEPSPQTKFEDEFSSRGGDLCRTRIPFLVIGFIFLIWFRQYFLFYFYLFS